VLGVFARCDTMVVVFSVRLEMIVARCWAVCPVGPFCREISPSSQDTVL
jgi:hypothetical protein